MYYVMQLNLPTSIKWTQKQVINTWQIMQQKIIKKKKEVKLIELILT